MNAFGKRNGMGNRPKFGVAKPMKGGGGGSSSEAEHDEGVEEEEGGDQFPPIEDLPSEMGADSAAPSQKSNALDKLNERQNGNNDEDNRKASGEEEDRLLEGT